MISLNGSNWTIWKAKMEDLVYCKDLYVLILGVSAKTKDMSDDDWKKLDRKAAGFIRQWLDDSVFHHVSTETSAASLWQKLQGLYKKKTTCNKIFLIR